jgi:hypothetical protein
MKGSALGRMGLAGVWAVAVAAMQSRLPVRLPSKSVRRLRRMRLDMEVSGSWLGSGGGRGARTMNQRSISHRSGDAAMLRCACLYGSIDRSVV